MLPTYELGKLARSGGTKLQASGFNPSKSNSQIWPYPHEPLFKTCWLYRTLNGRTVASVALQLRILWACLRWDDMAIDPSVDGRIITNTDTGAIVASTVDS